MRSKEMRTTTFFLSCVILCIAVSSIKAVNNLSVRQDVSHPVVIPGYIDEAIVVVEPYGGYSLQSIYIKYSDHGKLGGNDVITHTFELPEGAVVNDLWLWIGDSVMQAKTLERRHAQGLWDTITALKHDPAFLKVTEKQFDLAVYPLKSGSFRKVKIQIMVPTRYVGKNQNILLPYAFFAADNNSVTPLRVLFRTLDAKWGTPRFLEDSLITFPLTVDTLGKRYKAVTIPNIKQYTSLTMTCDGRFADGWTSDFYKTAGATYFSFSMYEPEFFNPSFNVGQFKKSFIGLDLSGRYGVESTAFIQAFSSFFSAYMHTGDSTRIVLAGEGLMDTLPKTGWYRVDNTTAGMVQSAMATSRVLSAKNSAVKPRILFSDGGDGGDLYFPDVEKLATWTKGTSLYGNIKNFNNFDIVTTYWLSCTGAHETLSNSQLDTLQKALDAFFQAGGTFVAFYAYNRGYNHIASRYFTGLITPTSLFPGMLHRNIDGPIGHGFPNTFYYENSASLEHSDPDVDNELFNEQNKPVIISKKIGNGRFILTSMWHMQDNAGVKKTLCTTLLNLQNQSKYFQLPDVLKTMVNAYGDQGITEAVVMSNSDKFITKDNLSIAIDPALSNAAVEVPRVKTINLLDGGDYIPPIFNLNNQEYYGCSYGLWTISDRTGGVFYSRHSATWEYISQQISPENTFFHDSMTLSVSADGTISYDSIFDCAMNNKFFDNAHFYLGKIPAADSVLFSARVKYRGLDSIFSKSVGSSTNGSLLSDSSLASMYETEVLKRMLLAERLDTSAIIAFAIRHRLLTDITAFIALEPDDTTHFMTDPKDESNIGRTEVAEGITLPSAEQFVFMKPLIGSTIQFFFKTIISGTVIIKIFNLAGKEITGRSWTAMPGTMEHYTCPRALFGTGVYLVVAQHIPAAGKGPVQRKIERFTIR
jgi:hypothetical protein